MQGFQYCSILSGLTCLPIPIPVSFWKLAQISSPTHTRSQDLHGCLQTTLTHQEAVAIYDMAREVFIPAVVCP